LALVSFSLKHKRRWLVIGMLFSLSVLNYFDRQILSVLSPTLRRELGFGPAEYSYIVTAFLAAYTIGQGFSGRIIDSLGVKLGAVISVGFWSFMGMLHAFARGWAVLAVLRFLLGLGESFGTPSGLKVISEWVPRRERALSTAIFSNGYLWGAILAPPIASFVALQLGWRWAFLIAGASGAIWIAVWWRFYDSPERQRTITAAEREFILRERDSHAQPAPFPISTLLTQPLFQGILVARLLTDPLPYFFQFWMPEYLQSNRGFTLAMLGLLGWIPFFAADVGGPGGGALSDWLVRRGWTTRKARFRVMLGAACVMPLAAVAVRTGSVALSLGLMAALLGAHSCWITNLLTMSSEAYPRGQVATVIGLTGMAGGVGGMIANLVTGQVLGRVGYVPVFTALAFLHLTAWLFLRWSVRRQDASLRFQIYERPQNEHSHVS
jgi:ACS family hexuronate transporter-like MFS transporter